RKQRDALLESMTDSVAGLVLGNNYRQTQAISLAAWQAAERSGEYRRFISNLEEAGRLNRELEFMPSDQELADRRVLGQGLTRPEIAILVSYAKAILKEELIASDLGRDPMLMAAVTTAFPPQLVERFPEDVEEHRLRREIMCTQVANDMVNRVGFNFVARLRKATGAPVADIARAYTAVMHIYAISDTWDAIEALDYQVDAAVQQEMIYSLVRLLRRASRWLLRNRRHELSPSAAIEEFAAGVATLRKALP